MGYIPKNRLSFRKYITFLPNSRPPQLLIFFKLALTHKLKKRTEKTDIFLKRTAENRSTSPKTV